MNRNYCNIFILYYFRIQLKFNFHFVNFLNFKKLIIIVVYFTLKLAKA